MRTRCDPRRHAALPGARGVTRGFSPRSLRSSAATRSASPRLGVRADPDPVARPAVLGDRGEDVGVEAPRRQPGPELLGQRPAPERAHLDGPRLRFHRRGRRRRAAAEPAAPRRRWRARRPDGRGPATCSGAFERSRRSGAAAGSGSAGEARPDAGSGRPGRPRSGGWRRLLLRDQALLDRRFPDLRQVGVGAVSVR